MEHKVKKSITDKWIEYPQIISNESEEIYRVIHSVDYPESGFSLTGYIHPEDAKLLASAPSLLAERDQLKVDLKLVNECWQRDMKDLIELKQINAELVATFEKILPKLSQLQDETAFTWPEKIEALIEKAKAK